MKKYKKNRIIFLDYPISYLKQNFNKNIVTV